MSIGVDAGGRSEVENHVHVGADVRARCDLVVVEVPEAERLVQVHGARQTAVALERHPTRAQRPSTVECGGDEPPAGAVPLVRRRDRHLHEFDHAVTDGHDPDATDDLGVEACDEHRPAGLDDAADRVAEDRTVLVLEREVPLDPRLVERAERLGVSGGGQFGDGEGVRRVGHASILDRRRSRVQYSFVLIDTLRAWMSTSGSCGRSSPSRTSCTSGGRPSASASRNPRSRSRSGGPSATSASTCSCGHRGASR
ncbi:hypothetical protein Cus16_1138 [Curtobacterium sp. ER1/6]|nr:hypothetical protein Cus16_1138 [Curtobacterium sp. ER1/6]